MILSFDCQVLYNAMILPQVSVRLEAGHHYICDAVTVTLLVDKANSTPVYTSLHSEGTTHSDISENIPQYYYIEK